MHDLIGAVLFIFMLVGPCLISLRGTKD